LQVAAFDILPNEASASATGGSALSRKSACERLLRLDEEFHKLHKTFTSQWGGERQNDSAKTTAGYQKGKTEINDADENHQNI
jgi:hypothetical protein